MDTPGRQLRMVQIVCILIVLTSIRVAMEVRKTSGVVTWVQWIVIVMAVWAAISGFTLQRQIVGRSNRPHRKPKLPTPFSRWRAGNLVRLSCATSVALWALVLRENGGPVWVVGAFFALGMLLLVIWKPGASPEQPRL